MVWEIIKVKKDTKLKANKEYVITIDTKKGIAEIKPVIKYIGNIVVTEGFKIR